MTIGSASWSEFPDDHCYFCAPATSQEYLEAGWSPKRPDDAELMAAYLQALQLVYAHNYESRMKVPSILQEAPPFKGNETLQQRMQQRLSAWEREYAQVRSSDCRHFRMIAKVPTQLL